MHRLLILLLHVSSDQFRTAHTTSNLLSSNLVNNIPDKYDKLLARRRRHTHEDNMELAICKTEHSYLLNLPDWRWWCCDHFNIKHQESPFLTSLPNLAQCAVIHQLLRKWPCMLPPSIDSACNKTFRGSILHQQTKLSRELRLWHHHILMIWWTCSCNPPLPYFTLLTLLPKHDQYEASCSNI